MIDFIKSDVTLTAQEEHDLLTRMAAGDKAASEKLYMSCLTPVNCIVARHLKNIPANNAEDYYQDMLLKTMQAVQHFDSTRGVRLKTYVEQYIEKEHRSYASSLHLSGDKTVRAHYYKIREFMEQFYSDNLRNPTIEEISQELGYSHKVINNAMASEGVRNTISDTTTEYETLAEKIDEAQEVEHSTAVKIILRQMLSVLSPRDREIVSLIYGLDGEQLSIKEAGERYNMPYATVRAIAERARNKMRDFANDRLNIHDYSDIAR